MGGESTDFRANPPDSGPGELDLGNDVMTVPNHKYGDCEQAPKFCITTESTCKVFYCTTIGYQSLSTWG